MATQTYVKDGPARAPSFARHSSTFKNDERCYETAFVVGPDYAEVFQRTIEVWMTLKAGTDKVTDYDINFSTEGGAWVGVVCVDH